MIANFPSPVLSVAADVVKDLDGGEALSSLWQLFSRCKESLQDGRRLENISWRLWYREVSQYRRSQLEEDVTPLCTKSFNAVPLSPTSDDGRVFTASPSQQLTISPPQYIPSPVHLNGHLDVSTSDNDHLSISSTSSMRPSPMRTKSNSSVGKIICDMIPDKLIVSTAKRSPPAEDQVASIDAPAFEPCIVVAPVPSALLPAMRLPPSTPLTVSSLFPRVVVVNPTPHPTPPATPAPSANAHPTLPFGQTHLIPPPRSPAGTRQPSPPPAQAPGSSSSELRASSAAASTKGIEDTLKPSDSRFFLQQGDSPSPERDSHSQGSTGRTPSDAGDLEPSSAASNHTCESTVSNKSARGRKVRKATRHAPARPSMHRTQTQRNNHAAPQRQATVPAAKARALSNAGSLLSNGLKATSSAGPSKTARSPSGAGSSRPRVSGVRQGASPATQRRPIVTSNSESEYETDTDDDSWTEEGSEEAEEQSKAKQEEIWLREAALEAQRQLDMFAKIPKRSYSNLNRTQSGLLSILLNPDPNVLPPGVPYRSNSSHDVTRPPRVSALTAQLSASKSFAALPTMARVTAQVSKTNGAGAEPENQRGYRLKGQPQAHEVEYDSDSGDENPDDTIQVSYSLAQQKLAALADPSRRRNSDRGPPAEPQVRPVLQSVAMAPIPLNHPWNLPPPAAPSTPRTTRRQMLSTELDEGLRRNLLWERQVSKTNIIGNPRRASGLLGNGLRPLTSTTTETDLSKQPNQDPGRGQGGNTSSKGSGDPDREDKKRKAMARNRSWAGDFHFSGW